MKRTMLTLMAVAAMFVAVGAANPQRAEAAPGYFSYSVGAPAYYPYSYPTYYASYPYVAPYATVPQSYVTTVGAPVVQYSYPTYYRGYYGRPVYAPYGYARAYRW